MSFKCLFLIFTAAIALNCSCDRPDAGQDRKEPAYDGPRQTTLDNQNFERGLEGWTITGIETAVSPSAVACYGAGSLLFKSADKANVVVSQSVPYFEDGLYDLTFYYKKSHSGTGACYVAAGSETTRMRMTALEVSPDAWKKGMVRGIEVKDGKMTVEIRCEFLSAGECYVDGLTFDRTDDPFDFVLGGDVSALSLVEANGGKYYWDGEQMDCMKLLKKGGFNIVRLRLYNDPGNPELELPQGSLPLPAGYQDEEDILRLARRAKEEGMQIQMTFHYSDYWSNGGTQIIPLSWQSLDYDGLKAKVYEYTKYFLERMKSQNTVPEYVSLGNETQAGMLYPYGACENMSQMCALYNAGAKAVREVTPDAKIIIHTASGGDVPGCNWLFGELKAHNVDYDVIGASYYPFWTEMAMTTDIIPWAKNISKTFEKPILLMECGYAWNRTLPDGWSGQIAHNGPYDDMTKSGQKKFMLEVFGQIKANPDCNIIGVLYWDPIFIEAGDAGWAEGGDNVVSNTTLFDFEGHALEVWDAFRYNN